MGKLESDFQAELEKEIEKRFPGAVVFKIETYMQGFPDLGILYKNKWAILECKRSRIKYRKACVALQSFG